jgi:hypothetical protein
MVLAHMVHKTLRHDPHMGRGFPLPMVFTLLPFCSPHIAWPSCNSSAAAHA